METPQLDKGNKSMNKVLQMELMKTLYSQAFKPLTSKQYDSLVEKYGSDNVISNLEFLIKTGAIEGEIVRDIESNAIVNTGSIVITAKGIDYLDPESIGNDFNAITIKIHSSSLAQIEEIIKNSGLTKQEQDKLLKRLKDKGLDHFVGNMVDVAFTSLPTAYALFKNLINNLVE